MQFCMEYLKQRLISLQWPRLLICKNASNQYNQFHSAAIDTFEVP